VDGWRRRVLVGVLPPLVLLVALVAVWQGYVDTQHVSARVLPSPGRIAHEGWRHRDAIWRHTRATLKETAIGFAVSVVVATVLAVAMDFSALVRRSLYPLLVGSQSLPLVVLAPLMVIWFGFGLEPKVILVVLVTFFPITVGWVDGFASTDADVEDLLRSMGARRRDTFRHARFPSALPAFFSGLRIGITYSVVGAIFAEYAGARSGLGIYMLQQKNAFRVDLVMAAVVVTAAISVALFALVSVLQRVAIPWHSAARRAGPPGRAPTHPTAHPPLMR
jgi:ABC-type nitrate/sulfonate/bicarbonate transport system permease component